MAFRALARDSLRGAISNSPASSSSSYSPAVKSLASSSSARRFFSPSARSNRHSLPPIPSRLQNGCMPFLSSSTIKMMWDQYQAYLLEKLNAEVAGSRDLENATLVHTIINTADKPEDIKAFNFASQALNNAFFLSGIVSPPGISQNLQDNIDISTIDTPVPQPPVRVETKLNEAFGSVQDFKNAFTAAAYGMTGTGNIWLAYDTTERKLGIVPTYGAGTILVQARQQRGPAELEDLASTHNPNSPGKAQDANQSMMSNEQEQSGPLTDEVQDPRPGPARFGSAPRRILVPLMCLSIHEHAWLPDWGICGKEEYLMRFWDVVDWRRVDKMLG